MVALTDIIGIAKQIYAQVDKAKTNKNQARLLSSRIKTVEGTSSLR